MLNRGRVYVAGPYSSDPSANTQRAIQAGARLADLGFAPHLPHLAHFWGVVDPRPPAFWRELGAAFLPLCDALLRIPGESAGADQDVAMAVSYGIPIFQSIEALDDHFDV